MAETVAKTGVKRDKDFMYYIKAGAVWRVPRKQPGKPKGRPEKVVDAGIEQDYDFIYFLDKNGNVARAKRAIGGQKRKKTARTARATKTAKRPAAKKAAKPKKAAAKAKKPVKKPAAKKPAKKPAKRR